MSVKEKMTAIADKIRALLGISGTMGLDAMAANLGTEQTNVSAAFTAIGNKGGTVPSSKVSGNLASAIRTIPTSSGGSTSPVLQSKSVSPSETAQTIGPDSGYDGLSSVLVGAISKTYVGSGVTKKAAATYTPGTSDQSIAAGQYLSGAQTIKGDANLKAANIKSGVQIFGVTGSYEAGSAAPVLQEKTIRPSADGSTVKPDSGYDGLSVVYVSGDADLVASNIKSGVNLFGITGTYTGDGVTVQRKTGSFTTNTSGAATVSCGFVPDIVLITGLYGQSYYEYHAACVFPEQKNSGRYLAAMAMPDGLADGVVFYPERTSNGFSITVYENNTVLGSWYPLKSENFSYVAIKYTA